MVQKQNSINLNWNPTQMVVEPKDNAQFIVLFEAKCCLLAPIEAVSFVYAVAYTKI
jgi:hypothetical protein